jgi:hypothetical protein
MKFPRRFLLGVAWTISTGYAGFLIVRTFFLINKYSVNVLWWDNFNYYFVLAGRRNYWQRFTAQLGPHREGFGLLLSSVIAPLSRWSIRAEAFAIGTILTLALIACLVLKARALGKLAWYDLIFLSSLFLSPKQYELWTITVNSSHSALPLLFLMLYCLCWTMRDRGLKEGLILSINFLAIFTGFGFFLGVITPVVFALRKNIRAVAISVASLALFFVGYKFDPANSTFRFLDPQMIKLPYVVALGLSHYFNFLAIPFNEIFGYGMSILLVVCFVAQARSAFRGDVRGIVTACLIGFSILFTVGAVEGRISLSLNCLMVSRYVPLFTPAFVGAYFTIQKLSKPLLRALAIVAAIGMALYPAVVVYTDDKEGMEFMRYDKLKWIAAYHLSGNLDEADGAVSKPIYPHPRPSDLPEKIQYLRDNYLNFFTMSPRGSAHPPTTNPSWPPGPPGPPPSGSSPEQSQ